MADEEFNEEYIAELLKKDAQKISASYARNGVYDVLPRRPVGTAPKPNTRFLKNIIRSTDSHNAALKQKELGDAAHRLRTLTGKRDDRNQAHSRERNTEHRSRHQEREQRKRKREYDRDDLDDRYRHTHRRSRERSRSTDGDKRYSSSRRREIDKDPSRSSHKHHHRRERDNYDANGYGNTPEASDHDIDSSDVARSSKHSSKKTKERKPRNSSADSDGRGRTHSRDGRRCSNHDRNEQQHTRRKQSKSRSDKRRHRDVDVHTRHAKIPTHASSGSESDESLSDSRSKRKKLSKSRDQDRHIRLLQEDSPPPEQQRKAKRLPSPDKSHSDDDPLASFLGPPLPTENKSLPPKVRGRGATSFASGTETRFSTSYRPQDDVNLEIASETEDWDQALEALRDRQKFRQAGRDRLLAAGFTKEEVAKMERGGERNESDVRWTKKGQAREWDRGKTVDENGDIAVSAEGFGRLT